MASETSYLCEIETDDPGSALSLLKRKIVAIDCQGDDGSRQQVGVASEFGLCFVPDAAAEDDDGGGDDRDEFDAPILHVKAKIVQSASAEPLTRAILACRVDLDQSKLDAVKHLLAARRSQLYVGKHPLKGAIAPSA